MTDAELLQILGIEKKALIEIHEAIDQHRFAWWYEEEAKNDITLAVNMN